MIECMYSKYEKVPFLSHLNSHILLPYTNKNKICNKKDGKVQNAKVACNVHRNGASLLGPV